MAWLNPSLLLLSLALTFGLATFDSCYNNTDIVHLGSFVGPSFWNGKMSDVISCAVSCVRRSLCMGFNFDPKEHRCGLFRDVVNRTRGREASEYKMYSYIANWTHEVDPNCFSRPCSVNAVCMPGIYGGGAASDCSFVCIELTSLCPKPSADFSGARSVNSTFTCSGGSVNATCLETLQWSEDCKP